VQGKRETAQVSKKTLLAFVQNVSMFLANYSTGSKSGPSRVQRPFATRGRPETETQEKRGEYAKEQPD
jgi:hypothetical protein